MTREVWLQKLLRKLRPLFTGAGIQLPAAIRVSCGWPSSRALVSPTSNNRTIGQCWPVDASADGTPEIFISPYLSEAAWVAATLTHELVHAADDCEHGHKAAFKKMAVAVGLTGKMTATKAGPELAERLNSICEQLGPYPHASLDRSTLPKQGTRMKKLECPDCGYTVRTTAKWIEAGMPTCPCGTEMLEEGSEPEEEARAA
jgi:hypothetical protein